MNRITINGREIGEGCPAYFIAEMSANHNGDYDEAVRILEAAKTCGADAVKLQTYTQDTMTIDCDNEHFRIKDTIWDGRRLYDLYREAQTPWEWHAPLKKAAANLGIELFSTPFDATAVDFLEGLGVAAHKVASFENVDLPLLRKVASTGKPVIVSTGMATLDEIEEFVATLRSAGCEQFALLKCTSAYPAPPEEMNLRAIPDLARRFSVPVGLSDHTMGHAATVAAVALGACIVEKHLTISRAVPGPDSAFSMEPSEFKAMVDSVRTVEKTLGSPRYGPGPAEAKLRDYRRSLFVVRDMKAGETFTAHNVRAIRPGHGLHTRHLEEVFARRAAVDIPRGTPLGWDLVK